jgi:hypothetical protein
MKVQYIPEIKLLLLDGQHTLLHCGDVEVRLDGEPLRDCMEADNTLGYAICQPLVMDFSERAIKHLPGVPVVKTGVVEIKVRV